MDDLAVKRKVLRNQLPYLRQSLGDPSRYIPYLVQGDILNVYDKELIRSRPTSKEKLETLLQLLVKEGKGNVSAFDIFVAALLEERVQSQVARELQRALAVEKESSRHVDVNG